MNKMTDWSLAQKLEDSKCRGIIIGIGIAVLVILFIVGAVIKLRLLKKYLHGGCCCDVDIYEDDFMDDHCDECVANEKDFA